MNDFPGPMNARPKGVSQVDKTAAALLDTGTNTPYTEKRGPGRPSKPDQFAALYRIAETLKGFDRDDKRQILNTILALME